MRRLCLALLLSHALAIQALIVAWGGAQAAVPEAGAFAPICKGIWPDDKKTEDSGPKSGHGFQHDCLSACAGAFTALESQPPSSLLICRSLSRSGEILRDVGLHVAITTQVFSARAPPKPV
ncbi:hypothetical protein V1291_000214 [Nitrobacteraceae bacterium AZCC 1564]